MTHDIFIFERVECKYVVKEEKLASLMADLRPLLREDEYPRGHIASLYLDTPDFRIIRASVEKEVYKEKLRLRGYNTPGQDDRVFLEIKKKFKGVVYKRRVPMEQSDAMAYIQGKEAPLQSQIMREIDYAMQFWGQPRPAVLLGYDREAFFWRDEPGVRLTFDRNLHYRRVDLSLSSPPGGKNIQPPGAVLMEIKTGGGMPCTLSHLLDKHGIYPTKFSKYKTAYFDILKENAHV